MKSEKLLAILFLLFVYIVAAVAQENESYSFRDSTDILQEIILPRQQSEFIYYEYLPLNNLQLNKPNIFKEDINNPLNLEQYPYATYYTSKSPLFKGDYSSIGVIKDFRRGAIIGSGSQNTMTSLGIINQASIGYYYVPNERLQMNINVDVSKYRLGPYANQTMGVSGGFSYLFNDRTTLQGFGSYVRTFPNFNFGHYTVGGLLTHQLSDNVYLETFGSYSKDLPGMSFANYGGYVGLDITEKFGTKLGVQRYYDPVNKRWETLPIVAPYYKFKKMTLEFDFGPVIREILQTVIFDNSKSNPTIRPHH